MFDFGNLIPVSTKREATVEVLIDCAKRFSQEFGCQPWELYMKIMFDTAGNPYYEIWKVVVEGEKKVWRKAKEISINEVILK